ncbi:MAG: hypothetical protein ACKVP3_02985 [Hyphomicrobiaceae bacterium]
MRSPRGRGRWLPTLILLIILGVFEASGSAPAEAQARRSEATFAVKGVAAGDVLNIRDRPDGKQIIGHVPPDGSGIVTISPRTKTTGGGTWVKIRFGDLSGWVNVRFLGPDTLQTASTASRAPSPDDLEGPDSKTPTDPRFQTWAKSATRGRTIAIMIVTCGAIGHRYLFLLTDMRKMLLAEWNEQAWLMFEEFASDSPRVGRQ